MPERITVRVGQKRGAFVGKAQVKAAREVTSLRQHLSPCAW